MKIPQLLEILYQCTDIEIYAYEELNPLETGG